jgi:2-dehydro-3-deoxyphosphogluconate aldolase/(4S)-4-hydroxy-2-oxoglutarate aldolase
MSEKVYETIENLGVVPVVSINDADRSEGLAQALIEGGIPCVEITFRTAAAEESIRRINKAFPDMLIGAGTVLTIEQCEAAIKAGASFIVSPGLDPEIVKWCQAHDVPVIPGVCTASEVQKAVSLGLEVLKFFPAEASGGVRMVNDLCGPFPKVKFMCTGGINLLNLADYAASPKVISVGGSWMAKTDMIEKQQWKEITALCQQSLCSVQGFKFIHFGINTPCFDDACDAASKFWVFGMKPDVRSASTFMDSSIEIMHSMFKGKCGHVGFSCFDVERSLSYLSSRGFTVDSDSIKLDEKGRIKVAYLKQEIAGFAIHLVRA